MVALPYRHTTSFNPYTDQRELTVLTYRYRIVLPIHEGSSDRG